MKTVRYNGCTSLVPQRMAAMATTKPKILIQLDTDPQPSVFDAVVAVDAGADHLFRHGGVTPANVRDLVYGALFTRGPADLHATAIFIGGSNVSAGEAILDTVKKTFFGPFRVSVLFDANGANTTAAAAVLAALKGARAARSKGYPPRSWPRPDRSAIAPRGCWPASARRWPSDREASTGPGSWRRPWSRPPAVR